MAPTAGGKPVVMEAVYPRSSFGWAFQRAMRRWQMPEEWLVPFLSIATEALATLARAPIPPLGSAGFLPRVTAVAVCFGISPWRLEFLCREAAKTPTRLRK